MKKSLDIADSVLSKHAKANPLPASGNLELKHPFQCIARLDVSNVAGQMFILLAIGLKVFAVDSQSGEIMKYWDAESAGGRGWISLMTVNDHFTYVAIVTSADKAVHILSTSLTCLLLPLNKRILPKRPSCISWTPDQKTLLAGDKFGDVYALPLHMSPVATPIAQPEPPQPAARLPEQDHATIIVRTEDNSPESEPRSDQPPPAKRFKPSATELTVHSGRNLRALENQKRTAAMKHDIKKEADPNLTVALGHVSMLTALMSTPMAPSRAAPGVDTMCRTHAQYAAWAQEAAEHSRTYILTADRDEHIRISRGLPQAHMIETYCLGHTSFVSALTTPDDPASNILFSGGGDDWLGVWDWLRGTLLCKIPLRPALAPETATDDAATDRDGKPTPRPLAVSGIWHWPVPDPMTDDWIRVAVACEGIPRLLMLTCKTLAPTSARDFEQRVHMLPGNVLDFALMNAETVVLSLDAVHARGSTDGWRDVHVSEGEEAAAAAAAASSAAEQCPRLFVVHVAGAEGPAATTSNPSQEADTSVPFDIDLRVSAALQRRDMDVVLDAERDQGKMDEMLYGVEKLRKWAGEHEDA